MSQFEGKTAVISGGAEGIGFAIARALLEQGMNLLLADIDEAALENAATDLRRDYANQEVKIVTASLDVADEAQWESLVQIAQEQFEGVHMLVNNAGVAGIAGPIEAQRAEDWEWTLNVNLMGVVFGAKHFVPLMKQHGQGGWLVNVASMAGMGGIPYAGPYNATKTAVVALSESWSGELKDKGIVVSVLCPGFVQTRIYESQRNRQERFQSHEAESAANSELGDFATEAVKNGIDPEIVAKRLIEALEAEELYVFTHPDFRPMVQLRSEMVDAAFERASQSPVLQEAMKQ